MDRLGLSTFWILMIIGGTEGPVPVQTSLLVLGGIPTVFLSTWNRIPMFGRNYINGSVEWIVVPNFLRDDGLLLDPLDPKSA